jgi:heme/copper-type cytochrome/quinol oxidase subunit 4
MTEEEGTELLDVAPGEPHDSLMSETISYVVGLGLALLLTAVSFWVAIFTIVYLIGTLPRPTKIPNRSTSPRANPTTA